MKKALSVFLMLALVGSVFAAEPVADVNITEFKGDASVQWGVDLDSGKTGFKNSASVTLKLNLLNEGSKSTTGDGVWGELVIKTKGDTFLGWKNTGVGENAFGSNEGMKNALNLKVYVDTAKLHFGPAYVGIKSGDTRTGALKMDAAIRSADSNNAKWLEDVGPDKYSQGVVVGFEHDMFNVAADLRSHATTGKVWYLTYTLGGQTYKEAFLTKEERDSREAVVNSLPGVTGVNTSDEDLTVPLNQYTNAYAMALEGEFTGVENLSVKAGVSYNFNKKFSPVAEMKYELGLPSTLGYSTSVGYKFNIDDTLYIRPQVGFTGYTTFSDGYTVGTLKGNSNSTHMNLAAGLLFGWGDIGIDANADVPFLDGDSAKKVSPGVGVVMSIPLPSIRSYNVKEGSSYAKGTVSTTENLAVRIMPSFFSGEILPGLTAAAYADIGVMQDGKTRRKVESNVGGLSADTTITNSKAPDMPFAVAFGAKYAIPVAAMTITPNMGLRYANNTYHANLSEIGGTSLFSNMGNQKAGDDSGYLNLKAGVDVAGLISNTTFSIIYDSDNLLNKQSETDVGESFWVQKAGTLNFKVKISL